MEDLICAANRVRSEVENTLKGRPNFEKMSKHAKQSIVVDSFLKAFEPYELEQLHHQMRENRMDFNSLAKLARLT
jgi:hypothetical protein